jgi:hypothetical protein
VAVAAAVIDDDRVFGSGVARVARREARTADRWKRWTPARLRWLWTARAQDPWQGCAEIERWFVGEIDQNFCRTFW